MKLQIVVLALSNSIFCTTAIIDELMQDGCAQPIADYETPALEQFPRDCLQPFFNKNTNGDVTRIILHSRVQNWGSNGRGGTAWNFRNQHCNNFFINLYQRIASSMPDILLTPHDLFHGHIIGYHDHGDNQVAVVFHAKEYPADLEIIKNYYQRDDERFTSRDSAFEQRNFVYLSARDHELTTTRNEIVMLTNRGKCAHHFTANNTLSEEAIRAILPKAELLGDVNMFIPQELSRIAYQFYSRHDESTKETIMDREEIDTGKSYESRREANELLRVFVEQQHSPVLYFLTGKF